MLHCSPSDMPCTIRGEARSSYAQSSQQQYFRHLYRTKISIEIILEIVEPLCICRELLGSSSMYEYHPKEMVGSDVEILFSIRKELRVGVIERTH